MIRDPIEPHIREHIALTLTEVEKAYGVRVLYAAESGSRAWGFGSPDSDYDVSFIYVHPVSWYLRLELDRDVIEQPLDACLVDLAGWDLQKALRLLLRSNPVLHEWLVSPIVYRDDPAFREAAKTLFEEHASQKALAHHYWSIARGQWRQEIAGQETVKLKKYFYAVRPLLSLEWIIGQSTPPPMDIDALLAASSIPSGIRSAVLDLLEAKRSRPELGRGPPIPVLDQWIAGGLDRLAPDRHTLDRPAHCDATARADAFFRRMIGAETG